MINHVHAAYSWEAEQGLGCLAVGSSWVGRTDPKRFEIREEEGKSLDQRSMMRLFSGPFLAGCLTVLMVARAQGALTITMEKNGLGYVLPTLNPDPSLSNLLIDLNKAIDIYNSPTLSSGIIGSGTVSGDGTFYQFPKDPVAKQMAHASSLAKTSSVTGGDTTPLVINLGQFKYQYLIVRWDGKQGSDSIYYIGGVNGGTINIFDEPTYINADGKPHNASSYWLADPSPVPEPSTVVAGALLLVPSGASTLRVVRRKHRV